MDTVRSMPFILMANMWLGNVNFWERFRVSNRLLAICLLRFPVAIVLACIVEDTECGG